MNKVIIFSCVMLGFLSFASAQHIFKNDTLYLKKGGFLTKDQSLQLGKGVRENGNFKFIEVNVNNIMRHKGILKDVDLESYHALSNHYNNKTSRIIRIVERGKKNKKFYAVIGVGDLKRYQVSIDEAIQVGEIIIDNLYKREAVLTLNN